MIRRYDFDAEFKLIWEEMGRVVLFADHEADKKADQDEIARLHKALHDISVVGLLSDEPDGPRCKRMREIAEKALKGAA